MTILGRLAYIALALPNLLVPGRAPEENLAPQRQPVLWEFEGPNARAESLFRDALVDGLRDLASEAGVVLCYRGGLESTDPAFQEICLRQAGERGAKQWFRWTPEITVRVEGTTELLSMSLTLEAAPAKKKRKETDPPNFHMIVAKPLDPGQSISVKSVASEVYESTVANREILDWFSGLLEYDRLLVERPDGNFPAPARRAEHWRPQSKALGSEVSEERRKQWHTEASAIAELLALGGSAEEARDRAEALLAEPGMPEDLFVRIEKYHERALEVIENATDAGKTSVAESEASLAPAQPPPKPEPEPFDVTFPVRTGKAGAGFHAGVVGRLRISSRDIRFVPDDTGTGAGWSVAWSDLKAAGKAEGLWDVLHPLVLETKAGHRYFLTEITRKGNFSDGRQILDYIAKGSKSRR